MRESCLSPSLQNLEKATEVNFARISNRFLTNWFIDPTLKNGSNAIVCGEIRLPIVQGSNLELSDLDFDVRLALKSLVVRGRWNQMISRYRNLKGNYVCWSHSDTTDRLVSLSDNHQSDNVTNCVSQSKCYSDLASNQSAMNAVKRLRVWNGPHSWKRAKFIACLLILVYKRTF